MFVFESFLDESDDHDDVAESEYDPHNTDDLVQPHPHQVHLLTTCRVKMEESHLAWLVGTIQYGSGGIELM